MRVKYIIDEDFVNYREASMAIGTASCGGKCCIEMGLPLHICHNYKLREQSGISIPDEFICKRYLRNKLTNAVVFGGLEPFEQTEEVIGVIRMLREECGCMDDVVIYTGYNKDEVEKEVGILRQFPNIIVKFGRYIRDIRPRFDRVLGVMLASENQYAERIS
jgi:pyruvate-formate lyase-activating enzyme